MKRDFLTGLGIADDVVDKIMAENGKDIENTKSKYADYDNVKAQLTDVKSKLDKALEQTEDAKKLKGTINQLQDDIKMRDEADKKATFEKNIAERFTAVSKDKAFVNDITSKAVLSEFLAAVSDDNNAGKTDTDIFDGITKNRDGIFKSANAVVDVPPVGNVPAEQIKNKPLSELMALANQDPTAVTQILNTL